MIAKGRTVMHEVPRTITNDSLSLNYLLSSYINLTYGGLKCQALTHLEFKKAVFGFTKTLGFSFSH